MLGLIRRLFMKPDLVKGNEKQPSANKPEHIITQMLWEKYKFYPRLIRDSFESFVARDGLRSFENNNSPNYTREDLETSLKHVANSPSACIDNSRCNRCYFGYLFDLPDECSWRCLFIEIMGELLPLPDRQRSIHEIAELYTQTQRRDHPAELLKDKIFEWCINYLKAHKDLVYLDEARKKFDLPEVKRDKNVR